MGGFYVWFREMGRTGRRIRISEWGMRNGKEIENKCTIADGVIAGLGMNRKK
jgi:hypothetical protein